jgi:hypothetical protein
LPRSMLHDQGVHVHAACPCHCPCWPCCMSVSVLHVYVPVHVHAAYLHVYPYVQKYISRVYKCRNAGLPGIQSVRHRIEKLTMPEQVRYRTKPTQSGIVWVWYRTKILDARMPMPASVCSIPIPSYAKNID